MFATTTVKTTVAPKVVDAVRAAEESRTLNARALTTARVHDRLRSAVGRLDRCLAAEQTLLGALATAPA